MKIGRCKVAERSVVYQTKQKLSLCRTHPSPQFAQNGPIATKIPWTCHPLTCPHIPNLVRVGCVLPNLFQKDWFFGPKTQYPAFSHRPLKIFYEVWGLYFQPTIKWCSSEWPPLTEQNIQLQELSRGLSADHFSKSYSKNSKNTNGPKFAEPRVAAVSPYFKRSIVRIEMTHLKRQKLLC